MAGKTVLVTGASRGIGAETVRCFAAAGANVVAVARSADSLAALADETGAVALACDVADAGQMAAAVSECVSRFGGLDVLIANAGVIEPIARIADADVAAWGRAIDINLKGVFHGAHAALAVMLASGGGTIITVSSGAAHAPIEGWSHYCSSKAGAAMLTRMLHKEYAESGIRAMGLSPGTVATQMQREIKASGINPVSELEWSDHIPADWPARALVWMCSEAAAVHAGTELSLRDADIRQKVGLA